MPSSKIAQMVLIRRTNGTRAFDKKYLQTPSPEPLVQIKYNFTEMFLIILFTKIAQMVLLCSTKGPLEL